MPWIDAGTSGSSGGYPFTYKGVNFVGRLSYWDDNLRVGLLCIRCQERLIREAIKFITEARYALYH
jgi:hypothetical protein